MIKAYLESEDLINRVDIIPVPTEAFPTTWVPFIRSISPPFQVVYARNPLIRTIFAYWGYQIDDLAVERLVSGTEVRQAIASEEAWETLVPEMIGEVIKLVEGIERLRQLALGENY